MRRALRTLTITTAALSTVALTAGPALADVEVDNKKGDGTATVEVGAKSPGKSGGKQKPPPAPTKGGSKVSNSGGGRTNQKPVETAPVNNYSRGDADSVSQRPDNVIDRGDGSTATYTEEGAYVDRPGSKQAFIDGMTMPTTDPEPAADPEPQPEQPQPEQPTVDPAELAQTAVSEMDLTAPTIASTPNDTETLGAVGLPVWLWVDNPGPSTTGPNTTSATAGPVTVTATATFEGMTIDMGDGTTITCDGPGTPYPGTGIQESPDCGHVYEQMSDDQPEGLYTVSITAHWSVTWESNTGESGEIPVNLDTTKQLRIGSYQSVVTGVS